MRRRTVSASLGGRKEPRPRGVGGTFAIAALFLGFASFISLLAPTHVVTLQREGDAQVHATVTRQLLLSVPIRTTTILVTGVSSTTHAPEPGPLEEGKVTPVRPEVEGVLVLRGESSSLDVSVSPAQLADVERTIRQFLEGADSHLRLWLVSNWKFAVVATSVVALPGILLLLGTAWHLLFGGPKVRKIRV
jgi:hypothetical protein